MSRGEEGKAESTQEPWLHSAGTQGFLSAGSGPVEWATEACRFRITGSPLLQWKTSSTGSLNVGVQIIHTNLTLVSEGGDKPRVFNGTLKKPSGHRLERSVYAFMTFYFPWKSSPS